MLHVSLKISNKPGWLVKKLKHLKYLTLFWRDSMYLISRGLWSDSVLTKCLIVLLWIFIAHRSLIRTLYSLFYTLFLGLLLLHQVNFDPLKPISVTPQLSIQLINSRILYILWGFPPNLSSGSAMTLKSFPIHQGPIIERLIPSKLYHKSLLSNVLHLAYIAMTKIPELLPLILNLMVICKSSMTRKSDW